jgi:hypothetical protein
MDLHGFVRFQPVLAFTALKHGFYMDMHEFTWIDMDLQWI